MFFQIDFFNISTDAKIDNIFTTIYGTIKNDTFYDDLYAYQKMCEAERKAQLEKEREKLKKKDFKSSFYSS